LSEGFGYSQQVYESEKSGKWDDKKTWKLISGSGKDEEPQKGDIAILKSGHSVKIEKDAECLDLILEGGDLNFKKGKSLEVANDLIINSGNLIIDDAILDVGNDLIIKGGANFNSDKGEISVGGTFSQNEGQVEIYKGKFLPKNISIAAGNELIIIDAEVNSSGLLAIHGVLSFNGSKKDKNLGDILISNSGRLNVSNSNDFFISGDIENNGEFNGNPDDGECIFNLSKVNGRIEGSGVINLRDVVINSPASYTNYSSLVINSSLKGSGSFINGMNANLVFKGDNSGGENFDISNFNASEIHNTVEFASSNHSQQWRHTNDVNNDYYNVIVNINPGDEKLVLAANIRVNGSLVIIQGDIVLGDNILELAPNAEISGSDADNYIQINGNGVVRQLINSIGEDIFVPIGDDENYSPIISFMLSEGSLGNNSYIDFSLSDNEHPEKNSNNLALGGDDDGTKALAFISRYWIIAGNDIDNPKYDVSFNYIDDDIVGDEALMVGALYRIPPGYNFNDWNKQGIINPTNNIVIINGADAFGDLYAMDNNKRRLPVQLISFSVKSQASSVVLEWATASEENNKIFAIERSVDGRLFENVSQVSGAGNSNQILEYKKFDLRPLIGRSYYRLKQIDFNGQFEYSEIKSVFIEQSEVKGAEISFYPNPVRRGNALKIKVNNQSDSNRISLIELYNMLGHKVLSQNAVSVNNEDKQIIVPAELKQGLYILRVIAGKEKIEKRIIIF